MEFVEDMRKIRNRKSLYVILFVLVAIFINGLNSNIETTKYDIYDHRVKQEMKVVFIADTHSCKYGEEQEELLQKVKSEKPDLILLGGDIIDDELPMQTGFDTIKDLAKSYPVFYVTGNHEIWSGKQEYIKRKINSLGIEVLEGNIKEINVKGNLVNILGLDDPEIGEQYLTEFETLGKFKSDNISILLAHRPEDVKYYRRLDIDYVFSSHAHGGQWRLPFILEKGIYAPNQGLFPKYTMGINEIYNFKMIVSRGLSRESTRIPRFYNKPELVVVNFKNK